LAEHFSFFDPVLQSDGTYDREYNAQQFTNYFKTLVTTGILKGERNELKLTATGTTMQTKIDTGVAYILGRYYENDSIKDLTHDTESLGVSRIDRVVIRLDLSTEARYVKSFIKKGAPSTNPVPPTLTQTQNIYEISLAQVRVVGGQTFIATNAVTDERGTNVICPWAGSNILPSFDNNALQQHINDNNKHFQDGEREKWDAASILGYRGYLSGSVDFDSITLAGFYHVADIDEANSVNESPVTDWSLLYVYKSNINDTSYVEQEIKTVSGGQNGMGVTYYRVRTESAWSPWLKRLDSRDYDKLFTLFGDKNTKIASAITDKGVPTSADATGDQMAANIRAIQTGIKGRYPIPSLANLQEYQFWINDIPFEPMFAIFEIGGSVMYEGQSRGMGILDGQGGGISCISISKVQQTSTGKWNLRFIIKQNERTGVPSNAGNYGYFIAP